MEASCAAWFEWIDSASNPADGLSRDGILDKWAVQQGWELTVFQPSDFLAVLDYVRQERVTRIAGMAPVATPALA
eukprot:16447476-Heterocapsa_arctica.AAC.1